jgi:hypothetical protein
MQLMQGAFAGFDPVLKMISSLTPAYCIFPSNGTSKTCSSSRCACGARVRARSIAVLEAGEKSTAIRIRR